MNDQLLAHSMAAALVAAKGFQPVIDALSAHVALIDGESNIVGVNRAWRSFADANGGLLADYGVGTNYIAMLDGMRECPACGENCNNDISLAYEVVGGLREVLEGRVKKFQLEYPCHSNTERRWFMLTVTPFEAPGPIRGVVAHEDITALKRSEEEALLQADRLANAFSSTISAISLFIEKRDPYTAGHQQQVARLCDAIASQLGMDAERRNGLRLGASIHDIGKISVPAEILARPGRLITPEYEIIRTHPEMGYDILKGIEFPWPIAEMIYQHHERLDGSGYPRQLSGEQICLEARILCVADVFDAMTSHRPYRAARPVEEGIAELQRGRGTIYDPLVVDAFMNFVAISR
ncbi:MAG: HD-GYP domain-containing protein [Rhodocyclales bacterium GT-UBC]|nr:MAG: HD-GYP domain-containing protein [Rhodocyclales bacterium GT-UBC]